MKFFSRRSATILKPSGEMLKKPAMPGLPSFRRKPESRADGCGDTALRFSMKRGMSMKTWAKARFCKINKRRKAKPLDSGIRRNDKPFSFTGRTRAAYMRPLQTRRSFPTGEVKYRGGRGGVAYRESKVLTHHPPVVSGRHFPRGCRRGGAAPAVGGSGFSPRGRRLRAVSAGRRPFRSPSRGAC